jgi:hypothetical protein
MPNPTLGGFDGRFHAERIVDGDASTLTALTLYRSGSTATFTIDENFHLVITDIFINTEDAGDFALLADGAAGGEYVVEGGSAAGMVLDRHLCTPYVCAQGIVPKFSGPGANKSTCIIEGYIITGN